MRFATRPRTRDTLRVGGLSRSALLRARVISAGRKPRTPRGARGRRRICVSRIARIVSYETRSGRNIERAGG